MELQARLVFLSYMTVKNSGQVIAKHLFFHFNILWLLLMNSADTEAVFSGASQCNLVFFLLFLFFFSHVLIQRNNTGSSRTFYFLVVLVGRMCSDKS